MIVISAAAADAVWFAFLADFLTCNG